jgi:Domain of Unknown Function (DUF1259)
MILAFCLLCIAGWTDEPFESRTGLKGTYNEAERVFKATFPRTDIKVSVSGFPLDPFMGLTSWAAFSPISDNRFMVMGDLVLFEDEVNPVMSTLLENDLDVTGLHNHFFFDQPRVFFMHIVGLGSIERLSNGVKKALETVKEVRAKFPTIGSSFEKGNFTKNSITAKPLESIFGMEGQAKDGMVKFVIGRNVQMNGSEFGKEMGINTWAAFGGSDDNSVVDGDFAVTEEELQPVLKKLRQGNINIVAIHNHMTMEQPRIIFLHFWGQGRAEVLAQTIHKSLKYE